MPYSLVYVLLEVRAGHGTERQLHHRSLGESQYEGVFARAVYDARKVPAPIQRLTDPDLRLVADEAPEVLRPRQRALDAGRRDLDATVVATTETTREQNSWSTGPSSRSRSKMSNGPPENFASTSSVPSGSTPSITSASRSNVAVSLTFSER
jgi:hypothetical protein